MHYKKIAFAFIGLLACLWGIWLAIPQSLLLKHAHQDLLKGSRLSIALFDVKKGFFYTVHIGHITINTPDASQTLICTIQNATITPDVLSFLKLSPLFHIRGKINGGDIDGSYSGMLQGTVIHLTGKNIHLSGLHFLEHVGIYGSGALAFNLHWHNDKGEMTFTVNDAALKGEFGGIRNVPFYLFNRVKGVLAFSDVTSLNPISFEGKGVYLRIKGIIRGQDIDGTMEVMMDSSFDQYPFFQATLKQYQVSPGNYLIPYHQIL